VCVCVNELLSNECIDSENIFLQDVARIYAYVEGVHLNNNM